MSDADDAIDLGPCCCCEGPTAGRGNIMMLEHKAPVPGTGWGCVKCGLPNDGAVAIVCTDCLDADIGKLIRPLRFAVKGHATEHERIPIEELTGRHQHRLAAHAAEGAAWN